MAVVQTLIGNVKGPQGDTGATGATGAQGDAATIEVGSVTTATYGTAASVTNSGTSGAAVFDFVIPQGAPGETVTDMQNLTLGAMTSSSASFPVPAVGETGKVIFGKIVKWFSDMAALVATKFDTANVVNNLTTTSSGYALDARQGKVLSNKFAWADSLYAEFTGVKTINMPTDYNEIFIIFRSSRGYATLYLPMVAFNYALNGQAFYVQGWYYSASTYMYGFVTKRSATTLEVASLFDNGSNTSTSITAKIFYR